MASSIHATTTFLGANVPPFGVVSKLTVRLSARAVAVASAHTTSTLGSHTNGKRVTQVFTWSGPKAASMGELSTAITAIATKHKLP